MSFIKQALIECIEQGCVYLEPEIVERLRTGPHAAQPVWATVTGRNGDVKFEALPWAEAVRLKGLVDGDDHDALTAALELYGDLE